MPEVIPDKIRSLCRSCKVETNHNVIYSHKETDQIINDEPKYYLTLYTIVECMGCDTPSFLLYEKISDSEIIPPYHLEAKTDSNDVHLSIYPQAHVYSECVFLETDFQYILPDQIDALYEEVRYAFGAPTTVLAGVGLRMLLKAICTDQTIPGKDLCEKIKNLHNQGWLSDNELPILNKLIEKTSDHELEALDIEYLEQILKIINHVLMNLYILPKFHPKKN